MTSSALGILAATRHLGDYGHTRGTIKDTAEEDLRPNLGHNLLTFKIRSMTLHLEEKLLGSLR